ncbi:aldehyde dehydrogenase family protein [Halocynthiibacter sp. C4]|uniref:aldehyde dehydrogenase family protein n=1 Tax=Halocynthiibacter sp. C4 TaxID=2992758 RepID=UPI00237B87DF|nr:aldehyde dehydrogenase family protein [Halocynthiibacter sp. C4]MDE0591477.1 aldehyde dehydrogenase family protein [Halocynthiibacter sp. C4]
MENARNFYINGKWQAPTDGRKAPVIDPSTEQPFETISLGGARDTDAAVWAARRALPEWSARDHGDRIRLLEALLEVYNRRAEDMARAISKEMGAPITLSREAQVVAGRVHLESTIRLARDFEFEHPSPRDGGSTMKLLEPIGVCGLITPWNWPMNQIMLKVAPALAMGCTVVLKPSEVSPLSGLLLAEMIDEAGFPPGVFNLVNGDGAGVGAALTSHPEVDMISFTGSSVAGAAITQAAASTVKRVALELGGKGANIIFADADPDAVERGVRNCFNNTGQTCAAPTRMLVERSRYNEALEIAQRVAETVETGPSDEEGRHIGPVVSERQFDKIQGLIAKGIDEGARVLAGGAGRPEGRNLGYFVRPTIFADVTRDMTVWREEIFGPVLCMTPFDTEAEAIELANDTIYGLTNFIQTTDNEKLRRVARALRSGMVESNGIGPVSGSPFGGVRQSGNGREGGCEGLMEFLETKVVSGWLSGADVG